MNDDPSDYEKLYAEFQELAKRKAELDVIRIKYAFEPWNVDLYAEFEYAEVADRMATLTLLLDDFLISNDEPSTDLVINTNFMQKTPIEWLEDLQQQIRDNRQAIEANTNSINRIWRYIKPDSRQRVAELASKAIIGITVALILVKEIRDFAIAFPYHSAAVIFLALALAALIWWLPKDDV